MKMHYSHRLPSQRVAQIVGLFILLPLLGLIVVGWFMAKAEHLFERKYHLRASLSKSYGLEPGAPVMMSGFQIGRVEQVELNDRGAVEVSLQMLSKYQNMVREDSEASVAKSGVFVGQTLIDVALGTPAKAALSDGAAIKLVEAKDIGDLMGEVQPVLDAVKKTLLRVEEITKDLHTTVQTGGRTLGQVERAAEELPAMVATLQRTVTSVERTAASLPEITTSVKNTLALVDQIAGDVKMTTGKLSSVIESTQDTVKGVKTLTESVTRVSEELPPLLHTAQATMEDVNTIVRGAKNTFPISRFVQNAGPGTSDPSSQGVVSLRGDRRGQ